MTAKPQKRQNDRNMTEGVIWKELTAFAVPLLVGNLFQQLYNTVDSIVVGNYVGKEALAAVGSVGPIINSLIGFFIGLSAGAGVVISQSYGAGNREKLGRAVHTTFCMTLICCVIFTILGVGMTPFMLHLMSTPSDVFGESQTYLQVYFAGVSGMLLYNMGAGVLRAVGDSRRPVYFLIVAACINTVLDVVFVAKYRMGIAGAAWATVISQIVSAILTLTILMRADAPYRLSIRKLSMDLRTLKEIITIGFPAALQQMITSISNVFVQSYINVFGSDVMAAWSAYSKLDTFVLLPMMSISLAATTFTGQNLGAGKVERIRKGTNTALLLSMGTSLLCMIPVMIFAGPLVGMFNQEPNVISYGILLIRTMLPFYLFACVNQIYAGVLRGLGDSKVPMYIMLGSFVLFRQIYLYTATHLSGSIVVVALGYPIGWILCTILLGIHYKKSWKKHVDLFLKNGMV